MLLPKDYVRLQLTGEHAIDKADAAGTLLLDLAARDWSQEVLEALGIPRSWLPRAFEGPEVTGTLTDAAAAATGLRPGTPVVAGGGDQSANGVGVGAVAPGTTALSLGTSGVIFASTDQPLFDPGGRVHAFCHAVPGRWHMMSVMLSAAGSLRWFRDAIAPGTGYDELLAGAEAVPAGSDGLWFLPYLSGERSPHPDPLARGAFVGLTLGHDRRHLTRAVLEGVAYGLRDGLDLMREAGMPAPSQIRISGGGTASPLWRQILADVLRHRAGHGQHHRGRRLRGGRAGGGGVRLVRDRRRGGDALVTVTPAATPGPNAERYAEGHARYRALYPALVPHFHGRLRAPPGELHLQLGQLLAGSLVLASCPG